MEGKINTLETNSMNENIRYSYWSMNEFKKSYQPTNNLVKGDKGNLVADSHSILKRWKNYFSQFLMHMVLMMFGRLKCMQQSHLCSSPRPLNFRWLMKS